MQRDAYEQLKNWKYSSNRKPLIIQGARQVGKTWLIQEFGKHEYRQIAYISFFDNEEVFEIFEETLDPVRLLEAIALITNTDAGEKDVLVVFDEIQECPRALTSLKGFCEKCPNVPLVAAGSLLGIALHEGATFPVGKVDYLDLYPMNFVEYLQAIGQERMANIVRSADIKMMEALSSRFIDQLKRYYYVGGMPEAVKTYTLTQDFAQVRQIQSRLLRDYELDFSKHTTPELAQRIRLVWNSVPSQLARENKKFIYSAVRKSARARGYEEAIQWLVNAGLIIKVNRISKPNLPLAGYENKDVFKLYMFDVGLLAAANKLDISTIVKGNSCFTEYKGAFTENYVCQSLSCKSGITLYYWSAENSSGEIDFIYDYMNVVWPVEVKAEENLRSKSLRAFINKYKLEQGLRLSLSGYRDQDWLVNMPLYTTYCLPGYLSDTDK